MNTIANRLLSNAYWKAFKGDGEAAHFYHATGFPVGVYNPFLSKLSQGLDGRFQLAFPKLWEAHTYTQPPNVMLNLERLNMPHVAIRGKPSIFFTEAFWQEWQNRCPRAAFKQHLAYGHLFPLESPSDCYELINAGLSEIM